MASWTRAFVGAALVAACGSSVAGSDGAGGIGGSPHSPSAPSSEAALEAGPEPEAGPVVDAPNDASPIDDAAVSEAAPEPVEAAAEPETLDCPATSCAGDVLVQSIVYAGKCYPMKWTKCANGCGPYGSVMACLPENPPGPCVLNVPPEEGCPFKVDYFCFETLEAACQCAACSATTTCTAGPPAGGGRLKWKFGAVKKATEDASSPPDDAGDPVDASATDGASADAPSDAVADAAQGTQTVTCK